jgi:hypothetical protein
MDPFGREERELTAKQAGAFAQRIRTLVLGDPFKRQSEYWARQIGLRGDSLARALAQYREEYE